MSETLRFDYHRSVAPMMWVLVALSSIELLVAHALLALWRPWIALAFSLLTGSGIAWLVFTIRSFRRLPVLIQDGELTMRVGRLCAHRIPLAAVAGFRENWTSPDLKARDVSNLALIAYPNIWIDLARPVVGRRGPIRTVAHKLDDPIGFRNAVEDARGELARG